METAELAAFRREHLDRAHLLTGLATATFCSWWPVLRCDLCRRGSMADPASAAGLMFEGVRVVPRERPVALCRGCGELKDRALEQARKQVWESLPRGGRLATSKQVEQAYQLALESGRQLAVAVALLRGPRGPGRPPVLAADFAIGVLSLQDVSDEKIAGAIGRTPRYVKDRRERSAFRTKNWMRQYEPSRAA